LGMESALEVLGIKLILQRIFKNIWSCNPYATQCK